jgi:hypothetical protein
LNRGRNTCFCPCLIMLWGWNSAPPRTLEGDAATPLLSCFISTASSSSLLLARPSSFSFWFLGVGAASCATTVPSPA